MGGVAHAALLSGHLVLVVVVATSLVLDSRIQAEQLSRELWVSAWAVLLCPLRTRIVQSFANNCEKNKIFDSPM